MAVTFRVSLQFRVNGRVLTSGSLPQGHFTVVKGGTKSKVLTSSLPQGVGLIAGH